MLLCAFLVVLVATSRYCLDTASLRWYIVGADQYDMSAAFDRAVNAFMADSYPADEATHEDWISFIADFREIEKVLIKRTAACEMAVALRNL
jgi:hypothetical protein